MCEEPEFDLPESFIDTLQKLDTRGQSGGLTLKPDADTRAMLSKIAEQTGFSDESVATALLYEAVLLFRSKGFVF
ncbi:MAG TPA: hypothetical protein VIR77_05085 [Pontiella sp.]